MSLTLLLFIFICTGALISIIDGARKKATQLRFINITTNFNPKISKNLELYVTPGHNGRCFDFNWDLSIDIPKKLHISIDVMTKNQETNTFKSLFQYDFDMCRVMDGIMSQALGRNWFKNMKRYGNFTTNCPILKGNYYLKKMQPNRGTLPSFIPNGFYYTKVEVYIDRDGVKDPVYDALVEEEVWYGFLS